MKRSIVISLLTLLATDLLACAIPGTHNYYLFSTVEKQDWQQSVQQRTLDNWAAYAGEKDLYWFNAEEMRSAAQKKGDALMITYIDNLEKYLEVAEKAQETWEYPSKQEQQTRKTTLMSIQKTAFQKTNTRLRSQFALLYMRCNMMLGMHQTNVKFWEKTATGYINTVYRDMMRNIYAGALLKTQRTDEATQIYIEQGDIESLYTYYYKKRSYDAIKAEYLNNPDSPAFPFLLQDFANNAQEAYDAQQQEENWPGKLFIRTISQEENRQMRQLCQQVVSEGKTSNPIIWQSLKAWLLFLSGDRSQALQSIQEAVKMKGTPRAMNNARALRLFIYASQMPVSNEYNNLLAQELTWLEEMGNQERGKNDWYENHYTHVYDRLVHQVLCKKYEAAGQVERAIAFMGVYDEQPKAFSKADVENPVNDDTYKWNYDYAGDFFYYIDTISTSALEKYLTFVKQQPTTALDRWLSARIRHNETFLHELLGTKYLRLGKWKEAIAHLEQVSLEFINTMNIVPFMARRDYLVEPWMQRQRISEELQMPGKIQTKQNQKLAFAQQMLELENGFGTMEPSSKALRAYQLATLYTQASYAGDCWYLTRYGKSILDEARPDELNWLQKASAMLTVAQYLSDFPWREKVYYAQAWLPIDSWYTEEWNDEAISYDKIPQPRSRQYRALYTLARYENEHAQETSEYVSRCDVLKQFLKSLKQ
jgi:hypothetical protein